MSSIFDDLDDTFYVQRAKLNGVQTLHDQLGAYVSSVIADIGSPSFREIARRSHGRISHSTVALIAGGGPHEVKSGTLKDLARALSRSDSHRRRIEEELFRIVRGAHGPAEPPAGFDQSRFWELFQSYQGIAKSVHRKMVDEHLNDLIAIIEALPKKTASAGQLRERIP